MAALHRPPVQRVISFRGSNSPRYVSVNVSPPGLTSDLNNGLQSGQQLPVCLSFCCFDLSVC